MSLLSPYKINQFQKKIKNHLPQWNSTILQHTGGTHFEPYFPQKTSTYQIMFLYHLFYIIFSHTGIFLAAPCSNIKDFSDKSITLEKGFSSATTITFIDQLAYKAWQYKKLMFTPTQKFRFSILFKFKSLQAILRINIKNIAKVSDFNSKSFVVATQTQS